MRPDRPVLQRLPLPFIAGVGLSVVACLLLSSLVTDMTRKKQMAMAIGAQLPSISSQLSLLQANEAVGQTYGADLYARYEEQASAYVLPHAVDTARTVRVLQEIALALRDEGEQVTVDALQFATANGPDTATTLTLSGDPAAVAHFLALLDLSGKPTLADVLGPQTSDHVLASVSAVSPASLPAATLFLALDPLQYALDPMVAQEHLVVDMPQEQVGSLQAQILDSSIGRLRSSLGPIASALKRKRVWPLPLLTIDHVLFDGKVWTVQMGLRERGEK